MIKDILISNGCFVEKNGFKTEVVDNNVMIGVNKNYALAYDCQKMLLKIMPHNKLNINNILINYINNFKRNIKTHNLVWSSEKNNDCIKIRIHKTKLSNIEASKLLLNSL